MAQTLVLVGYALAAWLASGVLVWAGYRFLGRAGQVAAHCGAVLVCFIPAFRLYFSRPDRLSPLAAASLTAGLIVFLDLAVVAPFVARRFDFFLSFWDWQLPAILLFGSIYLTGRLAS